MEFTEYHKFNKEFLENYKIFYEKYPNAMLVLDKELRVFYVGWKDIFDGNIANLAKINIRNIIYRIYISFVLAFIAQPKKKRIQLGIGGFKVLEKIISLIATEKGIFCSIKTRQGLMNIVDFALLDRFDIAGCVMQTPSAVFFYRYLRSRGLDNTLSNHQVMQHFDDLVAKEIQFARRLIKKLNIVELVYSDDCSPATAAICIGAFQSDVRFTVVAHGYVQDPKLISICPILADNLVLWTEQQVKDLGAVLVTAQAQKLLYLGFPKIHDIDFSRLSRDKILFVSEPILHLPSNSCYTSTLARLADLAHESGFEIIFRGHPQERDNLELKNMIASFGYKESLGSISDDLNEAFCVLGSNSSVLVEAAINGYPTRQITELKKFSFEGVSDIPVEAVPRFLCDCKRSVDIEHIYTANQQSLASGWSRYLSSK